MYPDAKRITLVEDNLSAHKLSALYEVLPPPRARSIIERIEVVRTPKHGSWLNVAELELSVLARQALPQRVATKEALRQQVTAWCQARNHKATPVDWQFTTQDARIKLKRLYPQLYAEAYLWVGIPCYERNSATEPHPREWLRVSNRLPF